MTVASSTRFRATALVFFMVAAVAMTWPLVLHLGDAADPYDDLLHAWILAWDWHALTHGLSLFDANIYYPMKLTLAYSDHLLGLLPLAGPLIALTGNGVFAVNVLTLLALALTGWVACMWIRDVTGSAAAGLIAGFGLVYRPAWVEGIHQIQIISFFGVVLIFWFMDRFMRFGRRKDWAWLFVGALFTALTSWYLTAIFTLCGGTWIIVRIITLRGEGDRAPLKNLALGAVAAIVIIGAVTWPLTRPYRALERDGGIVRSERDVRLGSIDVTRDLTNTSDYNRVWGPVGEKLNRPMSYRFFPGITFPLLGIIGFILMLKRHRDDPLRGAGWAFAVMGVVGLLMSMGPHLIWLGRETNIPLPDLWLGRLPGFRSMRLLHRYLLAGSLAMTYFAGLATRDILAKFHLGHRRAAVSALVFLLGLEGWAAPQLLYFAAPMDKIPEAHRWLKTSGLKGAVLEYPMSAGPGFEARAGSEYFSTLHFKPTVMSYSGYMPQGFYEIQRKFEDFPDQAVLDYLRALDIRIIILHGNGETWSLPIDPEFSFARDSKYILEERGPDYWKYRLADVPEGITVETNIKNLTYDYYAMIWPETYRKGLAAMGVNRIYIHRENIPWNAARVPIPKSPEFTAPANSDLMIILSSFKRDESVVLPSGVMRKLMGKYDGREIFAAMAETGANYLDVLTFDPKPIRRARDELFSWGVHVVKTFGDDVVIYIDGNTSYSPTLNVDARSATSGAKKLTVALTVASDRAWRDPRPGLLHNVSYKWEAENGTVVSEGKLRLYLPLAVTGSAPESVDWDIPVPSAPGLYKLHLVSDGKLLVTETSPLQIKVE